MSLKNRKTEYDKQVANNHIDRESSKALKDEFAKKEVKEPKKVEEPTPKKKK